jgi:ferritin-like metal-binding protein YciE
MGRLIPQGSVFEHPGLASPGRDFALAPARTAVGASLRNLRTLPAVGHQFQQRERRHMAKTKTLMDLFTDSVKDLYFAEKKILAALPKMAKAAENEQLVAAFEKHLEETEAQIERLEQVFEELEETPKGKKCPAILGIIEEGQEVMKEFKGSPALDAALIAAAQAVEHYEICRYGTMATWAKQLGLRQSLSLLKQTINEEEKTDKALSELAESVINQEAMAEAAE